MNTIVIAITSRNMDNFKHLPQQWVHTLGKNATRIIIHTDPQATIDGHDITTNFDLLINDTHSANAHTDIPWSDVLIANQLVTLPRPGKAVQSLQMMRIAKDNKFRSYRHIRTFDNLQVGSNSAQPWAFSGGFSGDVVVKAMHGARGIGQIRFDSRVVPVDHVLRSIVDGDEGLKRLKERHPSVSIPLTRENWAGESKNLLSGDVFLQEVLDDVKAEYRMLLRPEEGHWIYRRKRISNDGYEQACGVFDEFTAENDYCDINLFDELKPFAKEINLMFETLGMTYGAVDLFTTNDGKWGVFEYSNQFGTAGYDLDAMRRYHIDFIESVLP